MEEGNLAAPLTSPDEVRALLARAQSGDEAARERLVQTNMRLVAGIAHRFQRQGLDYDDLFQVGCIGLIKAIDGFDLTYDVRFSTYAVPVIMGEIRQYLRRQHPVQLGRKLTELARAVSACRSRLEERLSRQPTVTEIARELSVEPEDVVSALEASMPVASLDEPVYEGDGEAIVLGQRIAAVDEHPRFIENMVLKAALAELDEWERRLIVLRFFEEKSQAETARTLGVSQAHISRSERRILRRFRETFS